eukprot:CCRYP_010146-RA/>CCRYP_010146-RA protein AED:0.42 eAED:0.37 QI:0/0/0/1/1/1/3/0/389
MDKVCFYLNLTLEHLVKSRDDLCREDIFPSSYEITKEVEANASYEDDDDAEERSDESNDGEADFTLEKEEQDVYMVDDEWGTLISEQTKGIFQPIMDAIAKRTPKILHDFAYTAYVCSVRPDIVQDAKRRIKGSGAVHIEIENCVRRLLCHDVDGSIDGTIDIKTDQFWDELKHFQNHTGMFNRQTWFNSPDCIAGNSAKWHDKYSRHHAPVFGCIACQRAEHEKSDCLSKDACWGDEDEQFEFGLLKWGVDVEQLKKPVGPRRLFKGWIEDRENVMDNGAVMRTRLLKKYAGMVLDDIDVDPIVRMRVSSTKLKWIRREGWHAMAEPPYYVGDGDDDDKLEPLAITDEVLIELIKNTMQPEDLNVRMVKEGDNEVEGEEEVEDEEHED